MAQTEAQVTLANVLADELARHEHHGPSVVRLDADPAAHALAWLDFEHAGRIAARALVAVDTPEGWTGPTPIWTVRDDLAAKPVDRADAAAELGPTPAAAVSLPGPAGGPPAPSAGPGEHMARYARHRGLQHLLPERDR